VNTVITEQNKMIDLNIKKKKKIISRFDPLDEFLTG
jgi:hypothetical protein